MNSDMMQTTYISRVLLKVHLWAARKEKKKRKNYISQINDILGLEMKC
jgi:hypothetical protein